MSARRAVRRLRAATTPPPDRCWCDWSRCESCGGQILVLDLGGRICVECGKRP